MCDSCKLGVQVHELTDGTYSLLSGTKTLLPSTPCWTPGCKGHLHLLPVKEFAEAIASKWLRYSLEDFYQAVLGLGTKDERISPDMVATLFLTQKVSKIQLEESVISGRPILKCLTFENGKQIHFGISQAGATVYKVTHETDPMDVCSDSPNA